MNQKAKKKGINFINSVWEERRYCNWK